MKCAWHLCEASAEWAKDFCSHGCANKFRVTARRRRLKVLAVAYKGGRCLACGYSRCAEALIFHHLDPGQKIITIRSGNTYGWDALKVELIKCVLLCMNCHAEVHAGIQDLGDCLPNNPTPAQGDALLQDLNLDPRARQPRQANHCPCGKPITQYAMHCQGCAGRLCVRPTKITWPPSAELARRVAASSRVAVARELGVSDTAVKKRLLNHPP
jgi:hypothetical protein